MYFVPTKFNTVNQNLFYNQNKLLSFIFCFSRHLTTTLKHPNCCSVLATHIKLKCYCLPLFHWSYIRNYEASLSIGGHNPSQAAWHCPLSAESTEGNLLQSITFTTGSEVQLVLYIYQYLWKNINSSLEINIFKPFIPSHITLLRPYWLVLLPVVSSNVDNTRKKRIFYYNCKKAVLKGKVWWRNTKGRKCKAFSFATPERVFDVLTAAWQFSENPQDVSLMNFHLLDTRRGMTECDRHHFELRPCDSSFLWTSAPAPPRLLTS